MRDIAVIVPLHREGVLAHTALRSYFLARDVAIEQGIDVRFVLVADNADAETLRVARNHPGRIAGDQLIEVSKGDSALARNAGLSVADADFICMLDGDDLVSRNYFVEHHRVAQAADGLLILHPEMVVSFGMYNAFNWQVDQDGPYFERDSLLAVNPWISASFARKEVFRQVPYVACFPATTGFGYEDWYWNCETVAQGFRHGLAWGTAYFYRRKLAGSVNEKSRSLDVVMPRSTLFGKAAQVAE
jgi:glycosyltransferase involved in cell wall biosynthesis